MRMWVGSPRASSSAWLAAMRVGRRAWEARLRRAEEFATKELLRRMPAEASPDLGVARAASDAAGRAGTHRSSVLTQHLSLRHEIKKIHSQPKHPALTFI